MTNTDKVFSDRKKCDNPNAVKLNLQSLCYCCDKVLIMASLTRNVNPFPFPNCSFQYLNSLLS